MNLISNTIQIDKTATGYVASYNTDSGQVVAPFPSWEDMVAFLTDKGFAPVLTT